MRFSPFPGSSGPVPPCTAIYHRLASNFQLPLASGNSPSVLPQTSPFRPPCTVLLKDGWDSLQTREIHSTISSQIPPSKLLLLQCYGTPDAANGCGPGWGREHLAGLWSEEMWVWRTAEDGVCLFRVHQHLPKGHSPQEQFPIHYTQNEAD